MAKKLNKPRNILLFQNLYPINLYISDIDNWDEITQFLLNQATIMQMLKAIYQEVSKSNFAEDYAANLAAQMTEIILGNNIVRK